MNKSRTSKVFALSLGRGLTTIVTLVSGMVMARVLSQAELATYRQTLMAYEVAIPLLSLGLPQGIYYFLPTEKTRLRGVVVDALVMMVVMGLLYALFIALGGNHLLAKRFSNPAIVNTLVYLVPLPIVMLPAGLLASVMVVQDQVKKLTVYNVVANLAIALAIIVACFLFKTPESMVLVRVAISILIGLIGIYIMLNSLPRDDWRPHLCNMNTMIQYSIPLLGATALGTISMQLDKIVVSSMCSPEESAVYFIGATQLPLIGIITGSIAAVIQPDLRRQVVSGDKQAALKLFRKAAEKSSVILIPVMIFLLVSAKPFILVLFSAKYLDSVLPFQFYLMILPIRIAQYGAFQLALGLNREIMYRSAIGLAVNLGLSIVFVGWLGSIGAVIATLITLYFVNCSLNLALISRSIRCRWWEVLPFGFITQITLLALGSVGPVFLVRIMNFSIPPTLELLLNFGIYVSSLLMISKIFHVNLFQMEIKGICKKVMKVAKT